MSASTSRALNQDEAWLVIDFQPNASDPARIFAAAAATIEALTELDRDLLAGLDTRLNTNLVLVDVTSGSLKIWLRNIVADLPPDMLAKAEIRPLIGHFLVKAKYWLLKKLEDKPKDIKVELEQVRKAIGDDAAKLGLSSLPGYSVPSPSTLAPHLKALADARSQLGSGDHLRYEVAEGVADLAGGVVFDVEAMEEALTERQITSHAPMVLKVRRPDFLGNTKWDFRHGTQTIAAGFEDAEWLDRFRRRDVVVRPGDALQVDVRVLAKYAAGGELLRQTYTIIAVKDVIVDAAGSS